MRIWAHCLIKNEENFVWYSVMSVIDHVDKILIWDTGSTDATVKIIEEIKKRYPSKVDFKEVGEINPQEFTYVRQKMLEATYADWFLIVDGDEIWWDDSIKKVVAAIRDKGKEMESVVVPNILPVGDIYHYMEAAAGRYNIAGKKGHYALRGINSKIPGLKSEKPHGTWGWTDGQGKMIQDRNQKKILFVDAPYLHASFLPRSSSGGDLKVPKRKNKLKYELGIPFPRDFYYPEVFFRPRPETIPSPWHKMDRNYIIRALIQTPLKKLKRRIVKGKIGY